MTVNVIELDMAIAKTNEQTGNDCPGFAFAYGNPVPPNEFYYYLFGGAYQNIQAPLCVGISDIKSASYAWATETGSAGLLGVTLFDFGHLNYEEGVVFEFADGSPAASKLAWINSPGDTYNVGSLFGTPAGIGRLLIFGNECVAKAGTFELNDATGPQAVTGLGFQPDLVIFVGCRMNGGDDITGWDSTQHMFGAADRDGNQWVSAARSVILSGCRYIGGQLDFVSRMCRFHDAACIAQMGYTPDSGEISYDQLATLTSMDADGFTLDLLEAGHNSSGGAPVVSYLAIKLLGGSQASVGVATQGDGSIDVGFANPEVILFGGAETTDNVIDSDYLNAMVGGIDPAGQMSSWIGTATGALCGTPGDGAPQVRAYSSDSHAIRFSWYDETLKAEAIATLTVTGCDLDWTTDDSVARRFGWIALNIGQIACVNALGKGIYVETASQLLPFRMPNLTA